MLWSGKRVACISETGDRERFDQSFHQNRKGSGLSGDFIYGDPRYYCRFGFRCAEKYDIKTADGKFAYALLALELQPGALNNMPGRFIESATFEVDDSKLGGI